MELKPSPVQNSGLKRCHCHHDPPRRGNFPPLAATNKCLAESNKSCTGAKRLRSGFAFVGTGPLESIRPRWNKVVTKSGDIKVMRTVLFSWVILSMVVGVAAASRGDLAFGRRTVANCAAKSKDRTAMASIYTSACRLVSLPQLEESRSHVGIRPRDPNSRPDRLLDSSACASVLGRYSSLSTPVEFRSR